MDFDNSFRVILGYWIRTWAQISSITSHFFAIRT